MAAPPAVLPIVREPKGWLATFVILRYLEPLVTA